MQRVRIWQGVGGAIVATALMPALLATSAPAFQATNRGTSPRTKTAQSPRTDGVNSPLTTSSSVAQVLERHPARLGTSFVPVSRARRIQVPKPVRPNVVMPRRVTAADSFVNVSLLTPIPVPRAGVSASLFSRSRILIPAIGLDRPVYEGIAQNVINAGVAHWPGTAMPGGLGNVVLAGHRSTYQRPFHDIANVHPGDQIIFETTNGWRYVYRIDRQFVVANTAMWIKDQHAGHTVTIFTCHPIGSSRERLVTVGTLVRSEPLA